LKEQTHWPVLDGWRGISILLVLAGHMLPLGPKAFKLNAMVAATGLSIFFFLSGFLVVSMLLRKDDVLPFAIRRAFRILPLAWLILLALLIIENAPAQAWTTNLLFFANCVPRTLLPHGEHLWSLSVEVQFYLAVGMLVAIFGKRGLTVIPCACILVTCLRIESGAGFSIATWLRIDEILAGGSVALIIRSDLLASGRWIAKYRLLLIPLLFASSHESLVWLNYARPYVTSALILSTMLEAGGRLETALSQPILKYLARTSYALYVIHPLTYAGWLGDGDVVVRYSKRVISFFLTFFFAHISTFRYEAYWNSLGHRLASRFDDWNQLRPASRLPTPAEK
jgi:peptidoglycan/LPS O-acetylase OafA/YrhL